MDSGHIMPALFCGHIACNNALHCLLISPVCIKLHSTIHIDMNSLWYIKLLFIQCIKLHVLHYAIYFVVLYTCTCISLLG